MTRINFNIRRTLIAVAGVLAAAPALCSGQVVFQPPNLPVLNLPTGACCKPDGTCVISTIVTCSSRVITSGSFRYLGNGSTCTPNRCVATVIRPVSSAVGSWQPTGISGDGRTVIGMTGDAQRGVICRAAENWVPRLLPAGLAQATSVTYDGGKVVGRKALANSHEGYLFNVGTNQITTLSAPGMMAIPWAISPSGNWIAGACIQNASSATQSRSGVARWNGNGGGFINSTDFNNPAAFGVGRAVTDSGLIAGEFRTLAGITNGFVGATTVADFPGGNTFSTIHCLSNDGFTGFGYGALQGASKRLARWTAGTGLADIGDFTTGQSWNVAGFRTTDLRDCTGDGTVAVGEGNYDNLTLGWIWRQNVGMVEVTGYIRSRYPGTNLSGVWLATLRGISDDKKTICGSNGDTQNPQPWIITFPDVRN
jgi:hypothetical protein